MLVPEQRISFQSQGRTLVGDVRVPDSVAADERGPAFIVLHGFGSNRNAGNVLKPCALFDALGYVTLRFDMPGCGESDGERGRLICLEQVAATRDAVSLLAQHPNVDGTRIAIMGSSFGAAVVVYTGGVDQRVAAVISASGWGHGERKFRGQHPTPAAWAKFTAMLEEGKGHRMRTGTSLMVPRYDIVPIGITREGRWLSGGDPFATLTATSPLFALSDGSMPEAPGEAIARDCAKKTACLTSLLFHDALQRMLVLAGVVHHLRDLGLGDFVGVDPTFADALLVHVHHHAPGVLAVLREIFHQNRHNELHGRVVVVQ